MPLGYLRRPLFLVLVLYASVLACLHERGCWRAEPPAELQSRRRLDGALVRGLIISPLKEDFRGQKVFLRADELQGRPFLQGLLVYLPRGTDWGALRPGMPVAIEGVLRLGRPARNPGEFEEKGFLADHGASAVMKARSLSILGPVPGRWKLKAWAEAARRSCEGFFKAALPEDEARIFSGLTLGFKGPLRRDWNRAVQDAGAMHLLVPSGAKVAFVMIIVANLTTLAGFHVLNKLISVFLISAFYTLMVGADPPYARALWAGTALNLCLLCGRDSGAFQAMCLAALLNLVWEPRDLFSAGFQMTYAAVFGLVIAMPTAQRLLPGRPKWLRGLALVAVVSVVVQVMLWPIFANTFGRGSLAGACANLVLVPASGLLMAAGLSAWLTALSFPASAARLGPLLGCLARLFVRTCRFFASWPGAARDLSPMGPAAVIVYYLLAGALLTLPRWKASLLLAAAGLSLWTGAAVAGRLTAPAVRVLLLRSPGDPALMTFPDGRHWLVDPGTQVSALRKTLGSRGVAAIDRVILTRPLPWRAWHRLRRAVPIRAAQRVAAPWRFCAQSVCFEFGGPDGPRVLRDGTQYSITPSRLKLGAVEVLTDGAQAKIR